MPSRRDWVVLAVLVAARVLFGLQFQSVGALGPLLVGPLVADFAALGALIGAYQLAGCVVSLPGGALAARLGDHRILLMGLGLMALGGGLVAVAPGAGLALAGRVVSGGGGAMLNLIMVKLVIDRFPGPALPVALGWMLAGWPGGIALGLAALPPIAQTLGWRIAMAGVALLAALLLLAVPSIRAGGPVARGAAASSTRPPNWPALLAAAFGWMAFNIGLMLPFAFAPAMFTAGGMAPAEAGGLVSLASWVCTPMVVLGGWVAARLARPILLPVLALCAMVLSCLLLATRPTGMTATLALLSFGLSGGLAATPIFALVPLALPPAARGLGMGVFYTVYYAGMTLLPPLAGWARDATADPGAPILVAAGGSALSALAVLAFIPWMRRRDGIGPYPAATPPP